MNRDKSAQMIPEGLLSEKKHVIKKSVNNRSMGTTTSSLAQPMNAVPSSRK